MLFGGKHAFKALGSKRYVRRPYGFVRVLNLDVLPASRVNVRGLREVFRRVCPGDELPAHIEGFIRDSEAVGSHVGYQSDVPPARNIHSLVECLRYPHRVRWGEAELP